MQGFLVEMADQPGEVARITEALAGRGVNILMYGLAVGGRGGMGFVAADEQSAQQALETAGVTYRTVPLVFVRMEDRPGQAAQVSRRLADAGVNLQLWQPVDTRAEQFTVAIGVDDPAAARQALGNDITEWTYT